MRIPTYEVVDPALAIYNSCQITILSKKRNKLLRGKFKNIKVVSANYCTNWPDKKVEFCNLKFSKYRLVEISKSMF